MQPWRRFGWSTPNASTVTSLGSPRRSRWCCAISARERARFEVHRLNGSAGTFGFHGVSARAAELEELVLALSRSSGRAPSELAAAIQAGLTALLAAR